VGDRFIWVGQHPGVDFCNTAPVLDGAPVDLVATGDALLAWTTAAGLPAAAVAPPGRSLTSATVAWCHDLRDLLRAALDPTVADRAALGSLDDLLRSVPCSLSLAVGDGCRVAPRSDDWECQLRLELATATLPALALDPARVRRCAGPACVLLFHDTSRSGRRRWCDMASCGNRAKVAAHQARARAAAG